MRAYRITFTPKASKFVIEIQGFAGLYWTPAKDGGKVRHFETFDDASAYVKNIGLNKVYSDFTFKSPFGSNRPLQGPTLEDLKGAYGHIKPANGVRWLTPDQPYPTILKEQA